MTAPSTIPSPILIPAFPPVWAEVYGEDEYGIFAEFCLKGVKFAWRWIPPGTFTIGSNLKSDQYASWTETPAHPVKISRGFWFGETPLTQAQWKAAMGENPSYFAGSARPVESVSWEDCRDFSRQLSDLVPSLWPGLPTEEQWEYACRAQTYGAFYDGSWCTMPVGLDPALDKLGWFDQNSNGETHPVKGKMPNAWGLYDLHGNVWEWCANQWIEDSYSKKRSGQPPLASLKEMRRVVRGGSWSFEARWCRAACRDRFGQTFRGYSLGFRLAAGLEPGVGDPPGAERPDGTEVARGESSGTPRMAQ